MPEFLKKITPAKIVGRYGVLAVDTFSTLVFFMLLGSSWVLATTGGIFAFVKIWHFQQSFEVNDKLRKYLHRGTWLILAILSIYFLISLGLSITERPPEETVSESIAALEEAIAVSRIANVRSLTREQESLLQQNDSLAERMTTLNQWSTAFEPLQAQMNSNLARLGVIAEELNRIYAEQTAAETAKTAAAEKESATLIRFQAVEPIGAPSLMGRVIPEVWIDASIIVLFMLIGVGMEITLALSSLPAERKTATATDTEPAGYEDLSPEMTTPAVATEPEQESLSPDSDLSGLHKSFPKERKGYSVEEIMRYIDSACLDDGLIPDEKVKDVSPADCAGIREYLQSFRLRGQPIVGPMVDGFYQIRLDREKLKKLIALQCNVQRV